MNKNDGFTISSDDSEQAKEQQKNKFKSHFK